MGPSRWPGCDAQMPAIAWHDGNLFIVMNNRDSMDQFWPEHFTPKDNETRPAEPKVADPRPVDTAAPGASGAARMVGALLKAPASEQGAR